MLRQEKRYHHSKKVYWVLYICRNVASILNAVYAVSQKEDVSSEPMPFQLP
jgi:hypothetical protein